MDIKKIFTQNTLLVISIATVIGMGFNLFNFFVFIQLGPIEKRVVALEAWEDEIKPDIKLIPVIDEKIDTLKEDVKDIKSVLIAK